MAGAEGLTSAAEGVGAAAAAGAAGAEGAGGVAGAAGLGGSALSAGFGGPGGACPATILNAISVARLAGLLTNRLTVLGCADALTFSCTSICVALTRLEDST